MYNLFQLNISLTLYTGITKSEREKTAHKSNYFDLSMKSADCRITHIVFRFE